MSKTAKADFLRNFKKYKNLDGNSGIDSFHILEKSIILCFVDGNKYLYNQESPGISHVEKMKKLALDGKGLATYVNQHIRDHYSARLE